MLYLCGRILLALHFGSETSASSTKPGSALAADCARQSAGWGPLPAVARTTSEPSASTGAGQLRAFASNGNTIVAGDINGDGFADFEIQLTGIHVIAGADFVL